MSQPELFPLSDFPCESCGGQYEVCRRLPEKGIVYVKCNNCGDEAETVGAVEVVMPAPSQEN